MMTVQEAAEKWGVDQNTVRKWARTGRIKAVPLSEVLKSRGLPATKQDSWMIDQPNRPPLGVAPIVREKAVRVPTEEAPPVEAPTVNGFW